LEVETTCREEFCMIQKQIKMFLCVFQLLPIFVFSQELSTWVECSGEAAIQNITYEEALVIARRQARLDAIEKACGVSMHAETLVKDFVMAGDFVHALSYGRVVEERGLQWRIETLPSQNPGSPPGMLLRIEMKARVVLDEGRPDPSFKVDLNLNRSTYKSGEEVILNVRATKDCYVTVLNLGADDTVRVLFPNKWQTDSFFKENESVEIPDKSSRDSGIRIRVANLPGHQRDREIVTVIATKEKINILDATDISAGFGLMGTPKMAMMELAKWLSQMPVSERAEATAVYAVESREDMMEGR
jgi:hypothetical protein